MGHFEKKINYDVICPKLSDKFSYSYELFKEEKRALL